MKIKNLIHLLGIKGRPEYFTYKMHDFDLGDDGIVHYAQWQHKGESKKNITSDIVDAYREILNEGDFCIDIGAHSGDSTLPMALAVGKKGCVLALEPNPFVYHVLEKNARANSNIVNIKTMMAAAATNEGFLEFEYSDSGFCNGGRHEGISVLKHGHMFKQNVYCVNIEKELREDFSDVLPHLKFLKVDTEGYDLYVLRSIINIIEAYRPIIKTEVYKKTDKKYRRELFSLLQNLNYAIYKIIEDPIKRGLRLAEGNMNDWKHFDILCLPQELELSQS